jgi:hypothetical protein
MKRNHTGHRVGQDHHRAKVSDAIVAAIRAEYLPYVRGILRLSKKYKVPYSTVRDFVQMRTRPV